MKKSLLILCFILLLSGCNKKKESLEIEPTIESFAGYIVNDYEYGASGEFVDRYLDNTYATNLFLINLLKDSYEDISIVSCDDTGALLLCDEVYLRMSINISGGRISKIMLSEGHDD